MHPYRDPNGRCGLDEVREDEVGGKDSQTRGNEHDSEDGNHSALPCSIVPDGTGQSSLSEEKRRISIFSGSIRSAPCSFCTMEFTLLRMESELAHLSELVRPSETCGRWSTVAQAPSTLSPDADVIPHRRCRSYRDEYGHAVLD